MATDQVLELALAESRKWLNGLNTRSVAAITDLSTLRSRISSRLQNEGMDAHEVIRNLASQTEGGHHGSASGRFFAWVIGGSAPSALAADWMTSAWDQNAVLYSTGPAVSVVEEIAGEWIKELLDLPREASFAFTTGCQLAHFTCLAAARSSVLKSANWDINADGLFGAPRIRILTSEHRHASIDRAVRYLGIGNKSLEALATDERGQIIVEAFKESIKKYDGPSILVLDAADLNIGAFDPFSKLIAIAKEAGIWVHVDGAFGLFARASRSKKHLTAGVELADSWATDGHKWLNIPFDCGIAIIRDRQAHKEAMTIRASYIASKSQARDQIDWTPEWSRRARGVPVYAALRELGKNGVESLIDRTSQHCHTIVTEISKLPGAQMLWEPTLNQGLVRFLDVRENATDKDHDLKTDEIIAAINAAGEAFFSSTTWNGKKAMRVSVVNWRTSDVDVNRTIRSVENVLVQANRSSLKQVP